MKHKLISLLSPAVVLLLWELSTRMGLLNGMYFPTPSEIFSHLFHLLGTGEFWLEIYFSLKRLFLGSLIALPLAILLAITIFEKPLIKKSVTPLIALTYPLPKLAIFPLLLMIFGIGDASKIAIIAIGVFYLVLINMLHGLDRLRTSGFLQIGKVYPIQFSQYLTRILIRGTLPEILTGVKVGCGYGLVMVVASEFTASRNGIGYYMWNAWDQFRILDLYAGLIILSFFGLILFQLIDRMISKLPEMKD